MQQVNSYGVFVLGEVAHPGKYQLKSFTSVLQAVSLAGGFTPYAAKNKMFLLRKLPDKDGEIRIPIDYDEIVRRRLYTQCHSRSRRHVGRSLMSLDELSMAMRNVGRQVGRDGGLAG